MAEVVVRCPDALQFQRDFCLGCKFRIEFSQLPVCLWELILLGFTAVSLSLKVLVIKEGRVCVMGKVQGTRPTSYQEIMNINWHLKYHLLIIFSDLSSNVTKVIRYAKTLEVFCNLWNKNSLDKCYMYICFINIIIFICKLLISLLASSLSSKSWVSHSSKSLIPSLFLKLVSMTTLIPLSPPSAAWRPQGCCWWAQGWRSYSWSQSASRSCPGGYRGSARSFAAHRRSCPPCRPAGPWGCPTGSWGPLPAVGWVRWYVTWGPACPRSPGQPQGVAPSEAHGQWTPLAEPTKQNKYFMLNCYMAKLLCFLVHQ